MDLIPTHESVQTDLPVNDSSSVKYSFGLLWLGENRYWIYGVNCIILNCKKFYTQLHLSMTRIAIFASGNGTNAENIINYFRSGENRKVAEVTLIVCNKAEACVIERGKRLNVPVEILSRKQINDPEVILPLLEKYRIDFIVLAGFLLMIPEFLIKRFPDGIINIHPSLLPKYGGKGMYGHHVHEAVVNAREKETGITIHYVSPGCDEGRHIAQFKTVISPSDTVENVETKIHELEKKNYPEAIARLLSK